MENTMTTEGRVLDAEELGHEEEGVSQVTTDATTLAILNKSEIDQQITTAKAFPRSITKFMKEAVALVTMDVATAAECNYALPRGNEKDPQTGQWRKKIITGPSARFAEILAYSWGNCKAGARVVGEDDEFVTAQGMFYDLEKNVAITYEVKRRITDKDGKRYNSDMIGVTANAASSIALRNAVLKGIPKALWNPTYKKALTTIAGKTETLNDSRKNALQEFQAFHVTPDMVFNAIGVNGQQDITLDHIVVLRGMITALREGDTTVEQMFQTETQANGEHIGDATKAKQDDLRTKYANGNAKSKTKAATNGDSGSTVVDPKHAEEAKKAQDDLQRAREQAATAAATNIPKGSDLFEGAGNTGSQD
jgi:hypothetical protein